MRLPIATTRITLRPFIADDFADYAAYHALPEVYRYLYSVPPSGDALLEKFDGILSASFDNYGDTFRLAVVRNDDSVVMGETLIKLSNKSALQGEVGYIFNPAFSGKGYATEAVAQTLDYGFSELGFHRIFARIDTENTGSIAVSERLGMRKEAHLIQTDRFNDVWGDEYIYAVLADEWRPATGDASAATARD